MSLNRHDPNYLQYAGFRIGDDYLFPQDLLLGAAVTRVRHAIKIPVFMVPTEKAKEDR